MLKRTMLVFALMAILIGSLMAQTPRVEAAGEFELGRGNSYGNHYRGQRQNRDMPQMQMREKAMGRRHKGEMKPGRHILAMSEELELTDKQVKKITDIQTAFMKEQNLKQAQIDNLQIDKRDAMKQQNFKNAATATKAFYKLKEENALAQIKVIEDIYKELNSKQTTILKSRCKTMK
ncbi:MAG: hypothetical protein WC155_09630 [Candidatus Cloacimonadales bacterium]